jgi:2,5-diketo-D-gluconate reductase A
MNDGNSIPQLGFGVFQVPPQETVEAVTRAFEAGYRHIDTAAAYENEAEVGQAFRASGLERGDVFITTKCWNSSQGRDRSRRSFEKSLERLELDYVDLYLIHWPAPSQGLYVETWQTFVELRAEGLVRSIGVSNFSALHLRDVIEDSGVVPAVNQIELHPRFQQHGLRREHSDRGILTEAWSPLAQGRALDEPQITAIADGHERTPGQIVLRWHLQLGNVVFPKSVTPERIVENFDIFDFHLSESEMAAIAGLDAGERIGPDPEVFSRP